MAFASQNSQGAAITPLEKDYYTILDLPVTATPEQIKEQYRKLAKKYHPDARTTEKTQEHQPNPDIFRDVVEAYQVLSVTESRANYDLSRKKNPDLYKAMSEFQFDMEKRRDKRDKSGMVPKDKPVRGSYAEDRLNQLKKDREQYNVNNLGYYSGGIPKKDYGPVRGKSIGNPGEFHSPQIHNYLNYNHQDTAFLTPEDAIKFKHWMGTDMVDHQRSRPYYPMHYDHDFSFMRDRSFWLGFILLSSAFVYFSYKQMYEFDRWTMWTRREHIKELPAHHYINRGGVLLEKEFVGFEKYHTNDKSLMDWYKMAYPEKFANEGTK